MNKNFDNFQNFEDEYEILPESVRQTKIIKISLITIFDLTLLDF